MATKKYVGSTSLALVWEKIKNKLNTKVDKVDGKGLSSNDFTSDEKTKLANVATGAQVNVLEGIQKNGTTVTITNKIANITVPTKTSDITNDSGFITTADIPEGAAASSTTPKMDGTAAVGTELAFARGDHRHPTDTSRAPVASPEFTGTPTAPTASSGTNNTQIATTAFVNAAITDAVSDITSFQFEVVQSLPVTGEAGIIYLVAHSHGTGDAYDEYIWTGSTYEKIGNTDVDLSGYQLSAELVELTSTEIDEICV